MGTEVHGTSLSRYPHSVSPPVMPPSLPLRREEQSDPQQETPGGAGQVGWTGTVLVVYGTSSSSVTAVVAGCARPDETLSVTPSSSS